MAGGVVGEAAGQEAQELAFGVGQAGRGVVRPQGAERDGGGPGLVEEVQEGGDEAGFGDVQGALAGVGGVDGDQCVGPVEDDEALGQDGGGAYLAAAAEEPVGVGGGVRVVAGGVLVEGLHDDPPRQRFLVGGPCCREVLGTVAGAGVDAQALLRHAVGQLLDATLDGVHPQEAFAVGGVGAGAFGDQACDGRPGGGELSLTGGQIRLLAGEHVRQADIGGDGTHVAGAVGRGPHQHQAGEFVQAVVNLGGGGPAQLGQSSDTVVGMVEHGLVDPASEHAQAQRFQHRVPPGFRVRTVRGPHAHRIVAPWAPSLQDL